MNDVKSTLKHASIYSAGTLLGKMVSFLMLPFYSHILKAEGYGVIGLLDVGIGVLVTMLAYGGSGATVRLYHDQTDAGQKKSVVSTALVIYFVLSTVMVIPLIIFSRPVSGMLLANRDYSNLLVMALIVFVLDMSGSTASSWLLINSRSVRFASINLLKMVVGLSLNIWLIIVLNLGLTGYFISSLVAGVLSNGILICIAIRDCGLRFEASQARQLRDFMLPLVPAHLVSFASRQAERVLLRFQVNTASVGILEMGYKFPILIAQFVTTPFMQSWDTRRFEIADQPRAGERIGEMFTYYLFLATYLGLIIAVTIEPLLVILTPPEFHLAYRVARIEVVTLVLNGACLHLAFGLFYAKHTRPLAQLRSCLAVLKIGLSWLFIHFFGILGAAWSAAVVAVLTAIATYVLSERRYHIELEWKKILLIIGLAFGMFFTFINWDVSGIAICERIEGVWLPAFTNELAASPLGKWKNGRLPELLAERSAAITEFAVKAFLTVFYALLLPVVHDGTRERLRSFVRRRVSSCADP